MDIIPELTDTFMGPIYENNEKLILFIENIFEKMLSL